MRSKRSIDNRKVVDTQAVFNYGEAWDKLKEFKTTKFDETVELIFRLGVNPKYADQMVRGAIALPHGLGKKIRVLVFAKGEKEAEAKNAGADYVGGDELAEKIKGGWFEFDKVLATPDMMGVVSKIGKLLGPKGLMPSPKTGSVTFELKQTIEDEKKGKVDFKVDKEGNLHTVLGKFSFGKEKIFDNLKTLVETIVKLKPSTSKGVYIKAIHIKTSMSPAVKLDSSDIDKIIGGSL